MGGMGWVDRASYLLWALISSSVCTVAWALGHFAARLLVPFRCGFFIFVFYKNIFSIWIFTGIYPGHPAAGRPGRPTARRQGHF